MPWFSYLFADLFNLLPRLMAGELPWQNGPLGEGAQQGRRSPVCELHDCVDSPSRNSNASGRGLKDRCLISEAVVRLSSNDGDAGLHSGYDRWPSAVQARSECLNGVKRVVNNKTTD